MSYENPSDVRAAGVSLFERAKKAVTGAIVGAVGVFTSGVTAALASGADVKTAVIGSALGAIGGLLGGFGFVYATPANVDPLKVEADVRPRSIPEPPA